MKTIFNDKIIEWTIISMIIVTIAMGLTMGLRWYSDHRIVGAVVSNGRGCVEIGSRILYDGGSAVDSAIATILCEGILLPHSMGIGGGFVATIYTKSIGRIETLIARASAPALAHKDMFVDEPPIIGARAAAVPGEILGYWELHQRYGRLPWKTLFEPTIKLCREGYSVSKYLADALVSAESAIRNEPSMAEIFLKEDGSLYKEGDIMKRPVLGNTLERIANNKVDEMYGDGETGRIFTEDIQEMGGIITHEDLKNYKVQWDSDHHVEADIPGGYKLYTTPLPTSGVVLAFILNVMSDLYTDHREIYWQRLIETFKHAYGQRTHLGDLNNEPELYDNIKAAFEKLRSQKFSHLIRNLIHDNKTFNEYSHYGANFIFEEDHGTGNMAVLEENGDAITITSTINNYFGAKVRSRRTGIILNNEMDDFSTPGVLNSYGVPASPANYIRPSKRPMSSMCPAIILDQDGNVKLLVGAAGGTKITTSVAITIIRYLIFKETLQEAINCGRMHHQLAPMRVEAEDHVPAYIRDYLDKVGHVMRVSPKGKGFAAVTAIGVENGVPEPKYDQRRVGSTATVHRNNTYH
ncbi:hypothetical protein DOY81_002531 [Sarcophaga bullata]|nr:hypothetical protein DOY81_002531 [Sarcophaga bullata]